MSEEYREEIEQDRQIDPDSLDVAWLEQPNLFYKYSSALDEAMEKRNDAKVEVEIQKDNVDRVKAELDAEIRDDPESFDLEKVTETSIQSAIIRSDKYQEALKQYHQAKKDLNAAQNEVNQLFSCVNTMDQRKAALEGLARLLNQSYFSAPAEPKDLSAKYHAKSNQAKRGAKEKVKRQRKRRE